MLLLSACLLTHVLSTVLTCIVTHWHTLLILHLCYSLTCAVTLVDSTSLSPIGMCYLFQPSIQLSCAIHCIAIHGLGHSASHLSPPRSLVQHALHNISAMLPAIDVYFQPSWCVGHHWHALLTITVSSTMTSVFYLSVTTQQHVITCYELSNCHVFLTIYLCHHLLL